MVTIKGYYEWKCKFLVGHASGIWLPDCSKLDINWKNDRGVTICRDDIIVFFLFWRCHFFLVKLVTGPSFMSASLLALELWQFSFIRDWSETRKSKYPVWVWPSIWRLEWVRNTKFGANVPGLQTLPFMSY